jgi:membrane-bound ClpP family serine protease
MSARPELRVVGRSIVGRGLLAAAAGVLIALWAGPASSIEAPKPAAKPDATPQAAGEQPAGPKRIGRVVRIPLPITGVTSEQVRRAVRRVIDEARNNHLVLIFEFEVPPNQAQFGRGSQFGGAYELAEFVSGPELNGIQTVAYLPKSIQGHAVLVAIACDSIVMAEDAEIGSAGIDEARVDAPEVAAYKEIAGRRQTIPPEIAMGLLDPQREVLQVKTEREYEYVSPAGLEEVKKHHAIQGVKTIKPAGQVATFTGAEWRRLGFVERLVASRADVARAFGLPPEALEEELGSQWHAARVDLKGPIRPDTIGKVEQLITSEVQQHQTNFICLWIDSPGGSPADSMRLAQLLASPSLSRVRTVAYVPREARADAALIALACDQLVIGSRAVLGGSGAYALGADEIRDTTRVIREILAKKKVRSWSLPAAIIDPSLAVYRYTRVGVTEYMSEAEAAEQPAADKWQKGDAVTTPGVPFQAVGPQAVEFRLANRTADDFQQFKSYYGLERDPALLEPGWADFLIDALASPGVAVLLLIVGFVALYAELHAPGMGVGAFIAAVCFVLFFWSRFLGGTAGWLEVMLFLMGLACLALEVFVLPGFGIFGLGGGAMMLAALILASQTFVLPRNPYQFAQLQQSLWTIGGAAIGIIVLAMLLRRWLPRAPLLGNMLLEPPSPSEAETISHREALLDASDLVGARGTTTTPLVPGGKARFGNRVLDVITEGELIGRGSEVVVVEVRGNRILVEPTSSSS